MAATAKVIQLKGDPRNPESAEHIIEFPGGAISVCRTSDNKYWAHIHVHSGETVEDIPHMSKQGKIEKIRIDTPNGVKVLDIRETDHFAILISTK